MGRDSDDDGRFESVVRGRREPPPESSGPLRDALPDVHHQDPGESGQARIARATAERNRRERLERLEASILAAQKAGALTPESKQYLEQMETQIENAGMLGAALKVAGFLPKIDVLTRAEIKALAQVFGRFGSPLLINLRAIADLALVDAEGRNNRADVQFWREMRRILRG